jgi:hypothetical protein
MQAPNGVDLLERNRSPVSRLLYALSLGSITLCITLWIRAKTIGEDERGNAERRALFVGLWPPMFWLIGDTVAREKKAAPRGWRRRTAERARARRLGRCGLRR